MEIKPALNILYSLSQSLPYSLQVLSLQYSDLKSTSIFNKDTIDLWQKLDITLSSSKYSNLQYVQILWKFSESFWQEKDRKSSELEEKTEDSESIQQSKFKDVSFTDQLSDIDYNNIFLDYFLYLYKNKLLLCGQADYMNQYVYPVNPSAMKSKNLKTKMRLKFDSIETQL